jgi:hypothetical protein
LNAGQPLDAGDTLGALWPEVALRALRTDIALEALASLRTGAPDDPLEPLRSGVALRPLRADGPLRTGDALRAGAAGIAL